MDKYILGLQTSLNTAPVKEAITKRTQTGIQAEMEAKLEWKLAVNRREWAAVVFQRALFCGGLKLFSETRLRAFLFFFTLLFLKVQQFDKLKGFFFFYNLQKLEDGLIRKYLTEQQGLNVFQWIPRFDPQL